MSRRRARATEYLLGAVLICFIGPCVFMSVYVLTDWWTEFLHEYVYTLPDPDFPPLTNETPPEDLSDLVQPLP